ncbi:uncharacterized protein LOC135495992 [Lineus longissimus]|uniref:uncharacterized protein LOC135495992 n=1 Tax=Lineus longissimus TaxID=88925 RepID=UPI002B4CBBBC
MGTTYSSNFQESGEITSTPNQPEWIVDHVDATGLTIVEVERLWTRFLQLGCREDTGILESQMLSAPHIASDVFVRNILRNFKGRDGVICFETFCNAMQWIENSDVDSKIRAIFHLLNNGNPIPRDVLGRVLKRVYPGENDISISTLTNGFMEEMDDKKQGFIEENQFLSWVKGLPRQHIEMILEFHVVPQNLIEDDDILNNSMRRTTGYQPRRRPQQTIDADAASKQIPTDYILTEIAVKASTRDWNLLGNKLGFTMTDINDFDRRHTGKKDKVYYMLKSWRDREGKNAHSIILEKALRSSNMNDIAMLLQP